MIPSLWSWTLAEFRDRSAAGTPMPGGGSVSAVTATLGAGLVVMGLEVTRKGAATETAALLDPLLRSGRELLERLSAHADGDMEAFGGYLRARSLPQTSEAEKATRQERMQQALAAATEGPLAAGRDMVAALALARQVMEICKIQVHGDVAAGADILEGSLAAVLRSVDANLPGLADAGLGGRLQQERTALAEAAAAVRAAS